MKRVIVFLFFLSLHICIHGQVKIGEFKHTLNTNDQKKIKGSFSVVNKTNGNIATFISDKKNIYAYLTNEELKVERQLQFKKKKKYRGVVGKLYDSDNKFTFIVSNTSVTDFGIIEFDFKKDTVTFNKDSFNSKGLTLLQNINQKDKSHLLFLKKNTSELILRTYTNNKEAINTTFDLKQEKLLISEHKETTLSNLLFNILYNDYTITKIQSFDYATNNSEITNTIQPVSVETAAEFTKLYSDDNNITIVFDKNKFYTQILTLDLTKGTHTLKKIKKPLFSVAGSKKISNSFLYDDLLFIASASRKNVAIDIHNLKTKQLVKKLTLDNTKTIPFKNTPIVIKGKTYKNQPDNKLSKLFFKKIFYGDLGIAVAKQSEDFIITLGGKKPATLHNPMMSLKMGDNVSIYAVNNYRGFLDPHSYVLNSIKNQKSTYIKGIYDRNFTLIDTSIETTVYEKINDFIKRNKNQENSHVFEYNKKMIYSFYNTESNVYKFLAF
ncbi:hypothetical protein [uncultured Tenacibaculum sp.]|uniref:hypothetical protein n=1 Tax=uncultured Tenacibaculum sp. TaxID=174713 RepID=UPI00262EA484|nr:hypothetical protein [uncultured Tenacibaculum sp.]